MSEIEVVNAAADSRNCTLLLTLSESVDTWMMGGLQRLWNKAKTKDERPNLSLVSVNNHVGCRTAKANVEMYILAPVKTYAAIKKSNKRWLTSSLSHAVHVRI